MWPSQKTSTLINYDKGVGVTYGCPDRPTFFLNGALMYILIYYISKFEKQSMKTKHLGNSVYVLLFCTFLLSKRKKTSGMYYFCIWYFFIKIVLTYCEKKLFWWLRKTFEIRGWRPRIRKDFEIARTICLNSERSDQFLKQNAFLSCSWRFLRSDIY